MAKGPKKRSQDEFSTEFEEKVLHINRCTKATKGGRKFTFSALILVGDGHGNVGYGFAKANEVADAIAKGSQAARKNIYTIELERTTIPHEANVSWDGASILLKPAPEGTGVVAGSKVRAVLELLGVKDIIAKSLGSSNPLNQVKATFKALLALQNREKCFAERSRDV